MGGPDMGGLILYGACNGGPGIVRNVPNQKDNLQNTMVRKFGSIAKSKLQNKFQLFS